VGGAARVIRSYRGVMNHGFMQPASKSLVGGMALAEAGRRYRVASVWANDTGGEAARSPPAAMPPWPCKKQAVYAGERARSHLSGEMYDRSRGAVMAWRTECGITPWR